MGELGRVIEVRQGEIRQQTINRAQDLRNELVKLRKTVDAWVGVANMLAKMNPDHQSPIIVSSLVNSMADAPGKSWLESRTLSVMREVQSLKSLSDERLSLHRAIIVAKDNEKQRESGQ